ncbi:MAG: hypothetical protein ACRDI2_26215, partial [Chloroflexota bacterium]
MRLSGLVPLLDELDDFRRLAELAGTAIVSAPSGSSEPSASPPAPNGVSEAAGHDSSLPSPAGVVVVREAAKPYVVAGLQQRGGRPIVLVAADGARAQEWYQDLLTW